MEEEWKKDMVYLIQGFWFEDGFHLYNAFDYSRVDPALNMQIAKSKYSGVIYPDYCGKLIGEMTDITGESILFRITISPNQLDFKKRYKREKDRENYFSYSFRKIDNWWTGGYTKRTGENGLSNCVLIQVSEDFLLPYKDIGKRDKRHLSDPATQDKEICLDILDRAIMRPIKTGKGEF
jgi:hypothetical protein